MSKNNKAMIQVDDATTADNRALLLANTIASSDSQVLAFECGEEHIEVNVKKNLNLRERSRMVESIADFCFSGEFYAPYMMSFAKDFEILAFYTDLDLGTLSSDEAYRLTKNSKLMLDVYDAIDDDLELIFDDAEHLAEWRKAQLLKSTKADELYDVVTSFVGRLNGMLDSVADNIGGNAEMLPDILDAIQSFANKDEIGIAREVLQLRNEAESKKHQHPKPQTPKMPARKSNK